MQRLSAMVPGALVIAWSLSIPAMRASVITSAVADIQSPCAASDEHTATASAHCVFDLPQFRATYDAAANASAAGAEPFSVLSVDASVTPFAIGGNVLSADAQASMSQLVAISGGSGTGTVSYTFQLTGLVTGDDSASLHGSFSVSSGGDSQIFSACDVRTPVLNLNCGKTIVTNPCSFTFDSPFQLTPELDVLVQTIGHSGIRP